MRGTPNVDAEYDDILEACDISHALAGKWRVLFTQKYRPVLVGSGKSQVVLCQSAAWGPNLVASVHHRLCRAGSKFGGGACIVLQRPPLLLVSTSKTPS